ncbi:SWIM zinc finger family protein [Sphingobacterium sp. E70]|uniref:SWIM zinc finger family protein n=1 Tax=Sphingobacterium sp. E70 TaxID=2853439 RepID=UPI00211CCCEB|nr:SWIM zinc finger family protein [Sphingobacterium sp. E70]ULT23215.1 SWIM zinc finger family protein [Sphingobacterium sp. E70]
MALKDLEVSFARPSMLAERNGIQQLVLAHQAELQDVNEVPCFFWGKLVDPLLSSKCLLTLSKVVRSSFGPVPPSLRDPIVSAGTEQLRFEGFSSCNGVYARLDLLEEAIDGEFLAAGTTNVDFNEPMLNALNSIKKSESMVMGVGEKEVSLHSDGDCRRKKGHATFAMGQRIDQCTVVSCRNGRSFCLTEIAGRPVISKYSTRFGQGNYYLSKRGNKFLFSPLKSADAVQIGGIQRLRLLESLLPYVDLMRVYQAAGGECVCVVADFGKMRMTLALSPDNYRGFSGEGNVLENMVQEVPQEWIYGLNSLLKSNELFNPTLLSIEHDIAFDTMDSLTASLSSIGLLGYDMHEAKHYYRRLPFKTERILSLNPRLKNAKKLLQTDSVQIIRREGRILEARVEGSGVQHTVLIEGEQARCTCNWYTNHQGKRGVCKHVLAVKMQLKD